MLRRTATILIAILGLSAALTAQDPSAQTSAPKPDRPSIAKPPPVTAKRKPAKTAATTSRQTKKKASPLDSKKRTPKRSAKSEAGSRKNARPEKKSKPDSKKDKPKPVEQTSADNAETEAAAPAAAAEPAKKAKPPMGENDSIPFMQKRSVAETAPKSAAGSIWLKTIGSVLLILGLLFIGTWAFKKTGLAKLAGANKDESPELKILSSVTPKNGQTISVVRFGERVLLVGSTAQSFTLLADDEFEGSLLEDEESQPPFEFQGKPVSVSELLAREETTFEQELQKADSKLPLGLGGLA